MKKILLFLLVLSTVRFASAQTAPLTPTEKEALVNFNVTDYEGIPEEGAEIIIYNEDKTVFKKGVSDVEGKFKCLVPKGRKYMLSVFKFNVSFDFDEPMEIPNLAGKIQLDQDLQIRLVKEYVRTYTLDHVLFDVNKWDLKPESMPAVNKLLAAMKANAKMKVEIAGHTDDVGDDHNNMVLSQRRADSVRDYLVKNGIAADRIIAKGYGETHPVADNATPEGKTKNRRTEVKVISE